MHSANQFMAGNRQVKNGFGFAIFSCVVSKLFFMQFTGGQSLYRNFYYGDFDKCACFFFLLLKTVLKLFGMQNKLAPMMFLLRQCLLQQPCGILQGQ